MDTKNKSRDLIEEMKIKMNKYVFVWETREDCLDVLKSARAGDRIGDLVLVDRKELDIKLINLARRGAIEWLIDQIEFHKKSSGLDSAKMTSWQYECRLIKVLEEKLKKLTSEGSHG